MTSGKILCNILWEDIVIKYDGKKEYGIKIQQIPLEQLQQMNGFQNESENLCTLFWAEENNDIRLVFYSNTKTIQALEFMDYFVQNYVIVRGDAMMAQAVLTSTFLQSMMLDLDVKTISNLLETLTELYFVRCHCIDTKEFAEKNRETILQMPKYIKKKIAWAYVKTTDIMKVGDKFYLTSMENQSRLLLEAAEDLYIMIGHRGEIYHINKEKFERTYEPSDEQLDIFEQMLSYLPEVQSYESGEFITIDEIAYLCYPKITGGIYAIPLEHRTKVFNPYNNGEYFLGRKGDYLAIRYDDLSDIYVIQRDIFKDTYEEMLKE